ncbi:ankyrin repeat-containing protein [Acanthamoeba polyphaga mimivirus]|uniref:Ankyrin repeat-containing protein n=1 Tax=Acanthamoeba polyphaga mimivirus Kroon TaxID=3069720 RepID=A0A0G2YAW1_9VIRU|nr:ankyrin repeat-containing protein [Acanthamoeba polyphaga mimivirus]AKI80216.1 ankyrin repeat-containing protein [Acanthamoeba polyphaga mimivirus Kroon]
MSRYQPRIILNHPEKVVPDDIMEQFFLTIKTGDIDKIRNFVAQNKNKFNIIEKSSKPGGPNKTPIHAVLELDDRIADQETKLTIIKYLDKMGAPMDLPDSDNVWPIHLAAADQDEDIIDYMLKNKVSIDRKDSSNNTPLHYAIYGKQVPCFDKIKVGSIVPPQDIEKLPLNKTLTDTKDYIVELLNNNPQIKNNLIHTVNTIMNIPSMYQATKTEKDLETDIIDIFTEIASNPSYPSQNYVNSMSVQQNKLDQLINRMYILINDDLLRGLTNPLKISPNNTGWGPVTSSSGQPSPIDRILEREHDYVFNELNNKYSSTKNTITDINLTSTNKLSRETIPNIMRNVNTNYIDKLIFCPDCSNSEYGEKITLTKMLYLLVWSNYKINYIPDLVRRIMDNMKIMSVTVHSQIVNNNYTAFPLNSNLSVDDDSSLIGYIFSNLLRNKLNPQSQIDLSLADVMDQVDPTINAITGGINGCITNQLVQLFTNSDDPNGAVNLFDGILNSPINNLWSIPEFRSLREDINDLRPAYRDGKISWFQMLFDLIQEIQPNLVTGNTNDVTNNIFIRGRRTPRYILPLTPLPNSTNYGPPPGPPHGTLNNAYTYSEAFRVIDALVQYITSGNSQINATRYPRVFDQNINDWIPFIDNEFQSDALLQQYPELTFLYKILAVHTQRAIYSVIFNCVSILLRNLPVSPEADLVRNYLELIDDAYMYYLILPSEPNPAEFTQTGTDDTLADLKQHKWDPDNDLVNWFTRYIQRIPTEFIEQLYQIIMQNIDDFNYNNLENIRNHIESSIVDLSNFITPIINNSEFRNSIKKYFGTFNYPAGYNGTRIASMQVIPRLNSLIDDIDFEYRFDDYLILLRNGAITGLTFLTEIYGYFFVDTKKRLQSIDESLIDVNAIVADIIANINNETYYYIPQVILPALIKQLVTVISNIYAIKDVLSKFTPVKVEFDALITNSIPEHNQIINLGNDFVSYIQDQLKIIYTNTIDIIKYHNNVIEFLNTHSASQLINATNTATGNNITTTRVFNGNLIPIQIFPSTLSDNPNFSEIETVLRSYSIPEITYYADATDNTDILLDIFDIGSTLNLYHGTISFDRVGIISNSPNMTDNLQINIENDGTVKDIPDPIAGQWLSFDVNHPRGTSYFNAFIAYITGNFQFDKLNGMPSSVFKFLPEYLSFMKQQIIEEVVQFIVDNKDTNAKKIYDELTDLGTQTSYQAIPDVKNYIIIGKLTDDILNKLFEFAIRQSVSSWIYNITSNDPRYRSIIDPLNQTISIINKKDYLRLSLNQINRETITDLLSTNSPYVDYGLAQVETNPNNLSYTNYQNLNKFIYYLYNINYSSDNFQDGNCYYINPAIVSKLIDSYTLEAKNSDGNTPLHLAISMTNPDIVEILLKHGANPFTFRNIRNESSYDLFNDIIRSHLKYDTGNTVSKSIENFYKPFNDLLVSRLLDDKFKNNIIKNITYGIPIELIMYNHMFHLYLENYRYEFTIETRDSIRRIFKKYFNITDTVYPTDLFEINRDEDLSKILESEFPQNRVKTSVQLLNPKLRDYQKQLGELNNQIINLTKEKRSIIDSQQISFINNLIANLEARKSIVQTNISDLEFKQPTSTVDSAMISSFKSSVNSIQNRIGDRSLNLIDFYRLAFGRIGYSQDLYLNIWRLYLEKDILNARSMIFPLLDQVINNHVSLVQENKMTGENKQELAVIVDFYSTVKKYIESKKSLPNNLDDNPILQEEHDHIVYLINLILTPTIRNILISQIYQGLAESDLTNTLLADRNVAIRDILNSEYNGHSLDSFIKDILPNLSVKYFTTIYGDQDPNKLITSANDVFQPIIETVKLNRIIQITDDSVLIQNLRDYVIPFFINTYQNFIHHIELSIYAYEKYILNTYQLTKILQIMSNLQIPK